MRRYETRSTMMTSNRPLEDWGKLVGGTPSATAISDRFLQHAEILDGLSEMHSDPAVAPAGRSTPLHPAFPATVSSLRLAMTGYLERSLSPNCRNSTGESGEVSQRRLRYACEIAQRRRKRPTSQTQGIGIPRGLWKTRQSGKSRADRGHRKQPLIRHSSFLQRCSPTKLCCQ
jgi:hypothetical protein